MAADLGDKISQTHTLKEFISRRFDDQITFRNLAIIENVNGEEWIDRTLILDYLPELKNISQDVELTSEEYRKYKCNPDLLAYDIYGSTQLDFIILLINDIIDAKEFDSKKLKLPYVQQLSSYLTDIYNSNSGYLEQNRIDNNSFFY